MKKMIAIALALVMVLSLTACTQSLTKTPETKETYVNTESVIEVYSQGQLLSTNRTTYTYDPFGNISGQMAYQDGELYESIEATELDESGKPVKLVYKKLYDGTENTVTVEYDADGRLTKTEYRAGDAVTKSIVNTYDDAGRMVSTLQKDNINSIHMEAAYTYNPDGTMASRLMDLGQMGASLTVYEYDDQGRRVKETLYEGKTDADPVREYVDSVYAADGTCTQTVTPVGSNSVPGTKVITYDEAGNEILVESFNESGELTIRTTFVWEKLN